MEYRTTVVAKGGVFEKMREVMWWFHTAATRINPQGRMNPHKELVLFRHSVHCSERAGRYYVSLVKLQCRKYRFSSMRFHSYCNTNNSAQGQDSGTGEARIARYGTMYTIIKTSQVRKSEILVL